jgi:hypothetical protein
MIRSRPFAPAFVVALVALLFSSSAAAEERPAEHGVPLMTTGAALFSTSYAISLAIGVHATADFFARCGGGGPRPFAEALACLDAPSTMHLMVPIAGPFRALAEMRDADAADRALLVADGVAQIAGVVLAGIGMAQYIDGRRKSAEPAKSSIRVAPSSGGRGAGFLVIGTF